MQNLSIADKTYTKEATVSFLQDGKARGPVIDITAQRIVNAEDDHNWHYESYVPFKVSPYVCVS